MFSCPIDEMRNTREEECSINQRDSITRVLMVELKWIIYWYSLNEIQKIQFTQINHLLLIY
jgi:hypothetical protein